MARQLQGTSQLNVSVVVNNAINSVREARSSENSRKEAEFQKAVANGMSYEEQIKFREEQLKQEKEGGFQDTDYITGLEKSIATTKQLSRFQKIRTKYKESLDDYVLGKNSLDSYMSMLNDIASSEKDEGMLDEIRGLMSEAQKEKSRNELAAIKNRALIAQKDNSVSLVENSIDEVKNKRARASIAENEEEVAMWDDTLLALQGSKAKLQVENAMNEITFKINKFNPKANDKLGYLNDEISKADNGTEITFDGVTYPSLRSYWENKRGEYLSSGYFDEMKKDMDAETARIAATSSFGQIPTARIQAVNDYYNTLKTRPEFAPFVDQIEQRRAESVSTMTSDLAESIFNEEASTGDRLKAENAVLALEQKFGVSVSREPFARELGAGKSIATDALKPTTPAVTPTTPSTPSMGGSYQVAQGDSLSRIAARNGVSLLSLLDANPEYKSNPGLVRAGATIKLPGAINPTVETPTTPSVSPVTPQVTTPAPTQTVTPTPTVSPVTPTQTATPPQTVTPPVAPKVVPPNAQQTGGMYNVAQGDTLSAIALKNGKTVAQLAALNNIADPNKIKVGQQIKLQ